MSSRSGCSPGKRDGELADAYGPRRGLGLDDYFTRDFDRNIGAEIMGRNKFGPSAGPGPITPGAAGGAMSLRSVHRCSS